MPRAFAIIDAIIDCATKAPQKSNVTTPLKSSTTRFGRFLHRLFSFPSMAESLQTLDTWLFRLGNISAANPLFDSVMPIITSNSYIVPILLAYIVAVIWRGTVRDQIFVLLCIAALFLADQGTTIWKQVFMRPRPCLTMSDAHLLVPCSSSASFPSGHATNNAAGAVFAALWYRRWGWTLFVWALIASYSRVYCGVHYPSDILGGMIWGGCVALCVYALYERFVPRAVRERFLV
ncbi:MAG: phosphatase PAP2 family protein [Candidatus Kapabacteria bacterium]|nr:phosphatase PAP2 family protein [Candidatus Kapabacteria bacterium]